MVCLGYIRVNTLYKGDKDKDKDNNNNNNNNIFPQEFDADPCLTPRDHRDRMDGFTGPRKTHKDCVSLT